MGTIRRQIYRFPANGSMSFPCHSWGGYNKSIMSGPLAPSSIISHDVFLGTLSHVINSFIACDKAPRGMSCDSNHSHCVIIGDLQPLPCITFCQSGTDILSHLTFWHIVRSSSDGTRRGQLPGSGPIQYTRKTEIKYNIKNKQL